MSSLLDKWAEEDAAQAGTPGGSSVRMALEATPDLDAQKAARISQLAQSLGLPENFVIEDPRRAEMEATARRLESNSLLAGWASEDRLNVALAKSDPALGDSMSFAENLGRIWDRETTATGKSWDAGERQRQTSRLGNRYLAALSAGKAEEAAGIQAEAEALEKQGNPWWEQDAYGLLKPGAARIGAKPHVHLVDGKAVLLPGMDAQGQVIALETAIERFNQTGEHGGIFAGPKHALAFLAQTPEKRSALFAGWREKPEESWAEAAGLTSALEQLPRMLIDQLPTQINRAGWGALLAGGGAFVLGQAGPQVVLPEEVITVPAAAIAGGKAGWIAGAGESAFYSERGAFALELAREKDANGQRLAPEAVSAAANAYALLAAAEESLGEAFFLYLLKPLGLAGKVGEEGLRGFLRSAVKRAAFDKSTGKILMDAGLRLGLNATGEGLEESVQEATGALVEFLTKGYANQFDGGAFANELFTGENAARIGEAFKGGAAAGLWLGGGPIMVSAALDVRSGRMAQAYSENLMALYDKVEASSTKQLSPAHLQSALEFSGEAMREQVALPADAALELYQKGVDLLSPLGITEEAAQKAAAQGQDFLVPVAKLPANLDRRQMEAAAQIIRRTPEAVNAAEAARLDEKTAADAARVVELYQAQAAELDAMGREKETLRQEATAAIRGVPGLTAQAESLGGGVDRYVDDWLNVIERYALRMTATGQSPVETFRRIAFTSLRQSRPVTEAIAEDLKALQPDAEKRGLPAKPGADVLAHEGVESLDDLYALAGQTKDGFQSGIAAIAQATGGQAMFRPGDGLKSRARAQEKIDRDYPEIGAKRVLDMLGGTILYDSRADVEKALPEIRRLVQEAGGEIVRDRDRFDKPSSGYKDHFLNIRQPNGLITELLLTTKAMNHAKTESEGVGVGHVLYEAAQKAQAVLNDKNATGEQKAEAGAYLYFLRKASESYYGSTGDQSREIASLSGIVEPLNNISAIGASSANSSLYGELEPLLGNIRNILPAVENTKGESSNSINESTNTGELGPSDSQGVPTASRPSMKRAMKGVDSGISEPPDSKDTIAQAGAQGKAVLGAETAILLGAQGEQAARYEVRELAGIIPSHDPENQFAKRADYPDNVQERPYHSDAGEQQKVRGNALRLDPRLVVNNNPDLTNGPPAITREGVVLGGNSRAMSIQLAYAAGSDRAAAYKEALIAQAAQFGLDAEAVAGMEKPVLVRVVDSATPEEMGKLARLYNQTMMQGLQAKAEGVSKARLISQATLDLLAADMAEFDSLREFLDAAASKRFVEALLKDGVMEQTQLSRLTEKNGRLNDAGKTLAENALRGMVVPDYDILAAVPPAVLKKLDRVVPALARMKARGEGWDISPVVTAALRQVGKAAAEGKSVEVFFGQMDLMETDPDKKRQAVQALALTFAQATQKEVQARFEIMARDSEKQNKGQALLANSLAENITPEKSFVKAFLGTVAVVDGQSIAGFSPETNPAHAAIEYAWKNGGKGHAVSAALEKLHKSLAAKKTTPEAREAGKEMIRALSRFSGSVAVYEPKLGRFFRHDPGRELFQRVIQSISSADTSIRQIAAALKKIRWQAGTTNADIGGGRFDEGTEYLAAQGVENLVFDPFNRNEAHNRKVVERLRAGGTDTATATNVLNVIQEQEVRLEVIRQAAKVIRPEGVAYFQIYEGNGSGQGAATSKGWQNNAGTAAYLEEVKKYFGAVKRRGNVIEARKPNPGKGAAAWMLEGTEGPVEYFQPAFHGSPYRFEKFMLEHLGTGEGAQAYGWGLYFAGAREVAENYREVLSKDQISLYTPEGLAEKTLIATRGDRAAAIRRLENESKRTAWLGNTELYMAAIKLLENGFVKSEKRPGQLYEVEIPDNDVLLDWDAKPSDEHLKMIAEQAAKEGYDDYSIAYRDEQTGELVVNGGGRGEQIYMEISRVLGSPRAASEFLNRAGIKGIRYLDGSSRSQGEGSYNFVIFDDNAIEMIRTYYQTLNSGTRGSVKIYPEGYLINLFKNADLSTLFHETGHIFFEEMERAIQAGAADETMTADFDKLRAWLGATPGAALTEEQKEQLARGFEAYLMEGRAPSKDLEGAFARFRRWLVKIYREAVNLNVELTDEVRGVFDRMLATEREIAVTAARNELLDLTAKELDALNMTGTARNTLAGLMPKGREEAAESLQRARDENRKERLARYAEEAREELRKEPVYQARADMRKTPLDLSAVRDSYGEEAAEALRKKTPGGLRNEGGVDPEIFAAEHGFASGNEMIARMMDAPGLGAAVQARVAEKEARHDAEYEAFEHLLETKEVALQMDMVGRKLAELTGAAHIEREAYTRAAAAELAAMPLGRAMQTGNFLAAMRRALAQYRGALLAGDRATALTAHRKAMLNMEFARQSRAVAQRQGVVQRQAKRFVGMAKGDPSARFIVMDAGMRHGLIKHNAQLAEGRDGSTIRDWLAAAEADGYGIFVDDRVLFGPGKPWREMSVEEFETLAETVNQIVTVERNQRKLLTAQNKADLEEAAEEIAAGILQHRNPKALKTVEKQPTAVKALKGLNAIHTKIEALCVALDGDRMGATWEYIYKPITEAEDRQNMRFREMRDALRGAGLFGAYSRAELADMGRKTELEREIGEKLTRENRIALALNMGNETNIARIRDGHGWSDAQIAAVLRPLTRRDWEFVQAVWDYIGSFKEEAFALQEEVTGLRPAAVEARPFSVRTADGHTLELRGGYYPIKYDADKGFLAFQREQAEMDKQLFGGRNHGAAMTKNGHLKERAQGGMGSPLLLELSVITDHLFNVAHDLAYRKAVLDVAKVVRHKKVREAIEQTVGRELYRELMPWLQDVANERQEPMHQIHRWARWARASAGVMQMGYKVTTMLTQPLGFTQSIEVLGYKDAAAGVRRVYGNPLKLPELLEETFARSPFMANRIRNFDREVRDFAKQLKPGMGRFAWVEKVKDNAFVPMGLFQMSVDLPTWWGAYEKSLRENGGNEGRAAMYADSVVRRSQGGGTTKDLARVQRGGDLLRLTTMFYSYFNTLYNLGARRIALLKQHHGPKDIFLAANAALLLWFAPAVLAELAVGRGPDAEGEEPEEWLAATLLQYPFQAVVGVRDIAAGVFGRYGYQITPAQSAPKSLVQWFHAVNKALENEDAGELAKPTAEAAGYIFGLPLKQPIITVGNLWDYLTGEDPEFALRDLFFTKPKDRR